MDQVRIGQFIAGQRKARGLTQAQLAETLGITDRAVSKWETGRSLPDASLMLELCAALKITVNDLLSGEVVSMSNYDEKMEQTLLEMARQKEEADKRLLVTEVVIGVVSTVFLLVSVLLGSYLAEAGQPGWITGLLLGVGAVQFIVAALFALRIEQVAGYYKCGKCGHTHVPSYRSVNLAMHMGRTRYMKCPRCGKRSWQKKVTRPE